MDNRYDKGKLARDAQENQYFDVPWIKDLAEIIVADLVKWSNDEIYTSLGGRLECELPFDEAVNASAIVSPSDAANPRIEIFMGLVREIYRDSFTFPLLANQISNSPDYCDPLKSEFSNTPAFFEGGVPDIPESQYTEIYKSIKNRIEEEGVYSDIPENALACRFLMFEVMLTWVFFHELSHLVQRHYLFRSGTATSNNFEVVYHEVSSDEPIGEDCLASQAREVLADVEGSELTIRYLLRKKRFHFSSIYLLFCAQYCMFNRFYKAHESNLKLVKGDHPHPVIRNEMTSQFVSEWLVLCLGNMEGAVERDQIIRSVAYLNVKSSLISGVFWGNRYEKMDGSLTSFMKLSTGEYVQERDEYYALLKRSMLEQLETIKRHHMHKHNFTDFMGHIAFLS
jgi:hypothetical protein